MVSDWNFKDIFLHGNFLHRSLFFWKLVVQVSRYPEINGSVLSRLLEPLNIEHQDNLPLSILSKL